MSSVTIVIMGVSGSGKSTILGLLEQQLGWPAAEGDEFHPARNIEKMRAGHPLTDADRWPWLDSLATWIGDREMDRDNGLMTCSALKRSYRERLSRHHPSVWYAQLTAPRELIASRLRNRVHSYMPASLLESQLQALEPLEPDEAGAQITVAAAPGKVVEELLARLQSDRPGCL